MPTTLDVLRSVIGAAACAGHTRESGERADDPADKAGRFALAREFTRQAWATLATIPGDIGTAATAELARLDAEQRAKMH